MVKPTHNNSDSELIDAKNDATERVTVAGWKEACAENTTWIRQCYIICLTLFSCFCLMYICQSIRQWLHSGYKDEITDFINQASLPFSNVTICAQVYFNETFIRNSVAVPKDLGDKFVSETGQSIDALYRQFTFYLSLMGRPRNFSLKMIKYFRKLIQVNPAFDRYATFIDGALPPCEKMLKRCWFDGREFECCEIATRSIDDDGVCYQIMLNFDSDNAFSSNRTYQQTRPGPLGGLLVEASIALDDFPMFESDADNGFKIFVNALPVGFFLSPLTAPHQAITYVKISAGKHVLSENCAPHGHLTKIDQVFSYHDPEGFTVPFEKIFTLLGTALPCALPYYTKWPNDSAICAPETIYAIGSNMAKDIFGFFEEAGRMVKKNALVKEQMSNMALSNVDNMLDAIASLKKYLKHCTRWTYSSSASFFDLDKADGWIYSNHMYSKIYFYYAELAYRQHEEVEELTSYLVFCEFGNIVGFYWGMSIISFLHVVYYVPRYFFFLYRAKAQERRMWPVSKKRVGAVSNM